MRLALLNHEISNVHAAALILGAAGLLSRILGVLRDRLLAGRFGAGRELDIYYAAFQIPDFMSIVFFLGAGSAAILPIFQEYLFRDRTHARDFISELSSLFFWAALLVLAGVFFLAPFLMGFVAPGFSAGERAFAVTLTRMLLVSPVLLGFSSIFSAVVQSFQRFFAYAIAPIFYNLGIIFGIVVFVPIWGTLGLGGGVVLGAALHFLSQLQVVHSLRFLPRISWPAASEGVKKVAQISFPRALSIVLSHLTLLVLIAIASTFEKGSIAVFQLAQNLYYLPIGIFGVSYTTAIFPRLSLAYIKKDAEEFFRELFLGIRTILFWILPSLTLFIVLRVHIVKVAFGAGEFSAKDTRLTAALLAVFAIAMIGGGLIPLLLRGFYALEHTWAPFIVNSAVSLLSVALALFFSGLLRSDSFLSDWLREFFGVADLANVQVLGLAGGFAVGLLLNSAFLYAALVRSAKHAFPINRVSGFPLREILKTAVAALFAGSAAYIVRANFQDPVSLPGFVRLFAQGMLAGLAGLGAYGVTLMILRSEDGYSLWRSLERRMLHVGILPKSWDGAHDYVKHP